MVLLVKVTMVSEQLKTNYCDFSFLLSFSLLYANGLLYSSTIKKEQQLMYYSISI
jgi:hypothetical protein